MKPSAVDSHKPSATESDLIKVRPSKEDGEETGNDTEPAAEIDVAAEADAGEVDAVMEDADVKPLSEKNNDESEESKKATPEKDIQTPALSEANAKDVKINFTEKESGKKTEPHGQRDAEMEDTDVEVGDKDQRQEEEKTS